MNDKNITEPGAADDEAVRKHLAPLRDTEPSPEVRNRNMARIQQALDATHQAAPRASISTAGDLPLWRRRVAVPLPVAALFLGAFVCLAVVQAAQYKDSPSQFAAAPGSSANTAGSPPATPRSRPQQPVAEVQNTTPGPDGCTPVLQHEAIVIAGLGAIQTKDIYICENETP